MNEETNRYYELLGVEPGSGAQELKAAYRDLAKVWHPDRFAHDPRLQQKAQEKLKEINEAYETLISGRAPRRSAPRQDAHARREEPRPVERRRPLPRWQSLLLPALIFGAVFFAATRLLLPARNERAREGTAAQAAQSRPDSGDTDAQRQDANANPTAASARKRADQQPTGETKPSSAATAVSAGAPNLTPLPTVTVTIDPTTGMLASANCPSRARMTYPAGREPTQYCNAQHPQDAPPADADHARPKESRLKTLARRLKLVGKEGN